MVSISRWAARIWAVASLLFLAAFIFGDAENMGKSATNIEWVGLAFFPAGIILGLLIAFKRELLGGGIVTLSLVGFYIWHYAVSGSFAAGPWFALVAAPGLLFLITAVLSCARCSKAAASPG